MRIGRVVIPTAISLAIHAGLLALVAVATWTIVRPPGREYTTMELSLSAPAAADRESAAAAPEPSATEPAALPTMGELAESLALPSVARAGGAPAVRLAPTRGDRGGRIEVPSVSGGPASFAGVSARRARSVVFVVDCSGSMVSAMSIVLEELARSIDRLAPDQRFAIVPFRDVGESPGTFPAALGLVPATDENLAAARAFLRGLSPGGRSDPLAGLVPALALAPDAVFFLARSIPRTEDTWGDGEEAILAALEKLNPLVASREGGSTRPAQINAIQFLQPDPTGIMQAIGRAHGRGGSGYAVLTLDQMVRASHSPGPDARRIALDLERAAELLGSLGTEGLDATVLLGFPTREQITRVRSAAMEAMMLAENAEASLGVSDDGSPASMDPRVLLLSARAALLIAACDPAGSRRDALLARAGRAVALLGDEGEDEGGGRGTALSTWLLSGVLGARGEEGGDAGRELTPRERGLIERHAALGETSVELALALAIGVSGSEVGGARLDVGAPPFVDSAGRIDAGAFLLACDAMRRFSGDRAGFGAGLHGATYAAFMSLAVDSPSASEREAIVRARLAEVRALEPVRGGGEPLEELDRLLGSLSGGASGSEAELLGTVGERLGGLPAEGVSLGVSLVIERAIGLAGEVEGTGSLRLAAGLAERAMDSARSGAQRAEACGVMLFARARLVEVAPSDATREALLASIARAQEAGLGAEVLDGARLVVVASMVDGAREPAWDDVRGYGVLASVTDPASRARAGVLLGALDARLRALTSSDSARADLRLGAMRASVDASRALGVRPAIVTLEAFARELVEMGDADAAGVCREALEHPGVETLAGGRLGVEVLLCRSLIGGGDDRGALELLVGLASSMPEPEAATAERFWEVWTLTLETMWRAEPARRDEVRGHVTRLGLIDASLGGEPWAGRLRAVVAR